LIASLALHLTACKPTNESVGAPKGPTAAEALAFLEEVEKQLLATVPADAAAVASPPGGTA